MASSSIEIVPDARDLISELPAKAQTKHKRIVPDASRNLISKLPLELKVRILECLPTRDAARTALLSTHWNDVWLRLGRLAFDIDFFRDIRKCSGESIVPYKIITYILLQRVHPVKKFSLHLSALFGPRLEQSDLDQWCLYLSRNGIEELYISRSRHRYTLPFCIVSCPTIKQLGLSRLGFDCPINALSIFPGVTSLILSDVVFNHNVKGIVSSIPNLETLEFRHCEGISNFKFRAPKLEILSIIGVIPEAESRWLALHLETIKVLCLWHGCISRDSKEADIGVDLRLLKDPDSCIVNQGLRMLKTIKIRLYCGSFIVEMLFVEMLLSKSPTLESVVISEYFCTFQRNNNAMIEFLKELCCFPHASPKAQIIVL